VPEKLAQTTVQSHRLHGPSTHVYSPPQVGQHIQLPRKLLLQVEIQNLNVAYRSWRGSTLLITLGGVRVTVAGGSCVHPRREETLREKGGDPKSKRRVMFSR